MPSTRGARIKQMREANLLTQDELGRAIGAHARTVAGWEAERNISVRHLRELARLFGTTTGYIQTGRGKAPTATVAPPDGNGSSYDLEHRLAEVEGIVRSLREQDTELRRALSAVLRERGISA